MSRFPADLLPAWLSAPKAFVSYAREDRGLVAGVVARLEKEGIRCWLDRAEIAPSDRYREKIRESIRVSSCVVVFLSPHSVASDWVKYEVTCGETHANVIQVLLEGVRSGALKHPFRTDVDNVAWSAGPAGDEEFRRLVEKCCECQRRFRWRPLARLGALLALVAVAAAGVWLIAAVAAARATVSLGRFEFPAGGPPPDGGAAVIPANSATYLEGGYRVANESSRPQMVFEIYCRTNEPAPWVPVMDQQALATSNHIYLRTDTLTPGYLYLFGIDGTGRVQWLFPKNPTFGSSYGENPVPAGVGIKIPPGPRAYYPLDDVVGTETFIAVFSATRWPTLEARLFEAGTNPGGPSRPTIPDHAFLAFFAGLTSRGKGVADAVGAERIDMAASTVAGSPVSSSLESLRARGNWVVRVRQFRHVAGPSG